MAGNEPAMMDVVTDPTDPLIDYCAKPILLKMIRDASTRQS
jgi:hypothetical protein